MCKNNTFYSFKIIFIVRKIREKKIARIINLLYIFSISLRFSISNKRWRWISRII